MTTMPCQQDEVYAAEGAAPLGRIFRSIDEIQHYVDGLRDTHWWHAMGWWTVSRVEVGRPSKRHERNGSVGWYERGKGAGRIEMAEVHWLELYVLHELAHVLAEAKFDSHAHDPSFARIFLTLVSCTMGPHAYTALQQSFDQHGVNYDFPLLPESRFAL